MVLNKSDLADRELTEAWIEHLEESGFLCECRNLHRT